MDLAPDLIDAVVRIRESIGRLAKSKGWTRDDFRLAMAVDPEWGTIDLDLFAREYDRPPADPQVRYDEVYDQLEADLRTEPDIYPLVSVLLWPSTRDQSSTRAGDSQIRIDDALLNPGAGEPRPTALA